MNNLNMRTTTSNRMTLSSRRLKRLAVSLDMVVRLILLRPLPLSVVQSIRTTLLDVDKDHQKEGRCGTQSKEEGETGIVVARCADDYPGAYPKNRISMQVRIIEGKINRHSLADNTLGPMMELARLVSPKRLKKVPSNPVEPICGFSSTVSS
jgi:hypothetical protein